MCITCMFAIANHTKWYEMSITLRNSQSHRHFVRINWPRQRDGQRQLMNMRWLPSFMQKARWSSLDQLRGRQRILWKIFLKLAREDIARKGCSRGDSYSLPMWEKNGSGSCQDPFDTKTLAVSSVIWYFLWWSVSSSAAAAAGFAGGSSSSPLGFLEALIASDWWPVQASSCGTQLPASSFLWRACWRKKKHPRPGLKKTWRELLNPVETTRHGHQLMTGMTQVLTFIFDSCFQDAEEFGLMMVDASDRENFMGVSNP